MSKCGGHKFNRIIGVGRCCLVLILLFICTGVLSGVAFEITDVEAISNPEPGYKDYMGIALGPLGTDRFLVGSSRYQSVATNEGTVHLFDNTGMLLLTITNPAPEGNDHFGSAVVGLGTNQIGVSAYLDNTGFTNAGSVYLFDTNGVLLVTVTNPTPAAYDYFGASLAAVGSEHLVIGAYGDDTTGANEGCVYVYDVYGALQVVVTNPVPASNVRFGTALAAVSSNKFIVGAQYASANGMANVGAAYLYALDGTLLHSMTNPTPEDSDYFGCAVSGIGMEYMVVGASRDSTAATNSGTVYIFDLDGTLVTTITNSMAASYDYFGNAVCGVGNGHILVGARGGGPYNTGCAWLFNMNGELMAGMTNPAAGWDESFGYSVSPLGVDQYLVGVPFAPSGGVNDNHKAGRVYLYSFEEGTRYFVNDTSTIGDVWCSFAGDDANSGTASNTPKATLDSLLNEYTLQLGDTVYLDAGTYVLTNGLVMTNLETGVSDCYVRIKGCGPQTVLVGPAGTSGPAFTVTGDRVQLSNITFTNCGVMIRQAVWMNDVDILNAPGIGLEGPYWYGGGYLCASNVLIRDSVMEGWKSYGRVRMVDSEVTGSGSHGILSALEGDMHLLRCRVWSNMADGVRTYAPGYAPAFYTMLESCTILNNGGNEVSGYDSGFPTYAAAYIRITNSIVVSRGADDHCVFLDFGYYEGCGNNFYAEEGASIGVALDDWSISEDPRFADPDAGDFHLKSTVGRWNAAVGWVTDVVHSACIDAGCFDSDWTEEVAPNGNRINLGCYGGTTEASKGQTNAWVVARSINDGGMITGQQELVWAYGNAEAGDNVRIEYSADAGVSWMSVTTNSANALVYTWNSTNQPSAVAGLWRVVLVDQPDISDACNRLFVLRNSPLSYYVNDGSLLDDQWCTAVGASSNHGGLPGAPKDSVSAILSSYDLEGGDTVFIDSGYYVGGAHIYSSDGGESNLPVTFRGNSGHTTWDAGTGAEDSYVIKLAGANFVLIEDLILTNGHEGVYITYANYHCGHVIRNTSIRNANRGIYVIYAQDTVLDGVDIRGCQDGVVLTNADRTVIKNSCIAHNTGDGVHVEARSSDVEVRHCTIAYNGYKQIDITGAESELDLHNSIVVASGSGNACIYQYAADDGSGDGDYTGDYNLLFADAGATIGGRHAIDLTEYTYVTLGDWRNYSGADGNSISDEPKFVNGGDLHLRSSAPDGTFVDTLNGWTNFPGENSPGIDTGDPASPYENEPSPNGALVNLGAYGNTAYASKSADTDSDGLSDTFETYRMGSDPDDEDSDNDGANDRDEYIAGMSPTNAASVFKADCFEDLVGEPDAVILQWSSAAGRSYSVHRATNLVIGFELLYSNIAATPPVNAFTNVESEGTVFYRIQVE